MNMHIFYETLEKCEKELENLAASDEEKFMSTIARLGFSSTVGERGAALYLAKNLNGNELEIELGPSLVNTNGRVSKLFRRWTQIRYTHITFYDKDGVSIHPSEMSEDEMKRYLTEAESVIEHFKKRN